MSQENVEIVRRHTEAWQRGDLEATVAFYSEDVVGRVIGGPEGGGVYHGPQGVLRLAERWVGAFTDYWIEIDDNYLDADDHVVQFYREGGKGKGSGAPVEREGAHVFTLRKRKIISVDTYADRESLEAAGLRE
jgi:ketosteroid isomerase-like protein